MKRVDCRRVFEVFRKHYNGVPLEKFSKPYEALVSTLLSSRTNDDTTLPVCERLFEIAPDVHKLNELSEADIEELIYPVGFYKTKAKHLAQLASILIEQFAGRVPRTREELIRLPGVGRKTANLVLIRAFGKDTISVDTHVHRIANMLGWVDTKSPEQTELELYKVLPKKYWRDTNKLFVSIGRQHRSERQLAKFLEENGLI